MAVDAPSSARRGVHPWSPDPPPWPSLILLCLSAEAVDIFVTDVACDERTIKFYSCDSSGLVPRKSREVTFIPYGRDRALYRVKEGLAGDCAFIKIENAASGQLGTDRCASLRSFRYGSHADTRERDSFLLSLSTQTSAYHGVDAVLCGMLPGILKPLQNQMHVHRLRARIFSGCGRRSPTPPSTPGIGCLREGRRTAAGSVAHGGIRMPRMHRRPSLFTSLEGGASCTTLVFRACLTRKNIG